MEWRDIKGFEGAYQISEYGVVRSVDREITTKPDRFGRVSNYVKRGKVIADRRHQFGYRVVTLSFNNIQYTKTVHRLVAISFIDNPENLPLVRHVDGNPENNHFKNLIFGTQKDNMANAMNHGTVECGENRYNAILTNDEVVKIRVEKRGGAKNKELSEKYGISEVRVHKIVTGETWTSVGGPIIPGRKSNKLSKCDQNEVVKMRSGGATYAHIADTYSVSVTQVANILRRAS